MTENMKKGVTIEPHEWPITSQANKILQTNFYLISCSRFEIKRICPTETSEAKNRTIYVNNKIA